jgi:hypothetical protein
MRVTDKKSYPLSIHFATEAWWIFLILTGFYFGIVTTATTVCFSVIEGTTDGRSGLTNVFVDTDTTQDGARSTALNRCLAVAIPSTCKTKAESCTERDNRVLTRITDSTRFVQSWWHDSARFVQSWWHDNATVFGIVTVSTIVILSVALLYMLHRLHQLQRAHTTNAPTISESPFHTSELKPQSTSSIDRAVDKIEQVVSPLWASVGAHQPTPLEESISRPQSNTKRTDLDIRAVKEAFKKKSEQFEL